jgi:hypothetical protein
VVSDGYEVIRNGETIEEQEGPMGYPIGPSCARHSGTVTLSSRGGVLAGFGCWSRQDDQD